MSTHTKTASWIIREKDSGAVIMETFDKAKVDALNTEKYEAVPIQEYLASLNHVGRFQKIANALLQKHYGIGINDTDMCEDGTVSRFMKAGVSPRQAVVDWADEMDIVRIDRDGFYGAPSNAPITEEDELAVIKQLGI